MAFLIEGLTPFSKIGFQSQSLAFPQTDLNAFLILLLFVSEITLLVNFLSYFSENVNFFRGEGF